MQRPNILLAIADDQSYPYASAYGTPGIATPAFDRVASSGLLFHNAFVAAPQCSPSRAAILTGRNIWQLEEAGTHASSFPKKFTVFTDLLERSGYRLGYTGKPWAPGNWKVSGWKRNPVGPAYNNIMKDTVPTRGISHQDYYGNFAYFLSQQPDSIPFFFWYGGHEPHRSYEPGSGARYGKKMDNLLLPAFLPDDSVARNDLMDYAVEIEYFDRQLMKMLDLLQTQGRLQNTVIVVTADNGMPFPYAKANLQEFGTHVPLAISWPDGLKKRGEIHDLISMIDLAPTFLDLARIKNKPYMPAKSLAPLLLNSPNAHLPLRSYVLTGRERHTHARPDNLGYPARAIRTKEYLYIRNFTPDRWPVGDPVPDNAENRKRAAVPGFKALFPGYHDIDGSPSKTDMMDHQKEYPKLFAQAFLKRPKEQLYNIKEDPYCMHDLTADPSMEKILIELRSKLRNFLMDQIDPRMTGNDIFDSYPRYSPMRNFKGFHQQGAYNPAYQPKKP